MIHLKYLAIVEMHHIRWTQNQWTGAASMLAPAMPFFHCILLPKASITYMTTDSRFLRRKKRGSFHVFGVAFGFHKGRGKGTPKMEKRGQSRAPFLPLSLFSLRLKSYNCASYILWIRKETACLLSIDT